MLFEKTYGIDLGSSSVKVYSFFRNKTYIEKNMIASKGHTIIAMGNDPKPYKFMKESIKKQPPGFPHRLPETDNQTVKMEVPQTTRTEPIPGKLMDLAERFR